HYFSPALLKRRPRIPLLDLTVRSVCRITTIPVAVNSLVAGGHSLGRIMVCGHFMILLPPLGNVGFGEFKQSLSRFRVALLKHPISPFPIYVFLKSQSRGFRIQLEWVVACLGFMSVRLGRRRSGQVRIVTVEDPVA